MAKSNTSGGERKIVVGVDVGIEGAFCVLHSARGGAEFFNMPVKAAASKGKIEPDFDGVSALLEEIKLSHGDGVHVFLERAKPFAMGSLHAFNYGRGFAAVEIAIKLSMLPVTYVEPDKWCKVMHENLSKDLKPKAKSLIACERLYPVIFKTIERSPKAKKPHEGQVDSLLIAGYGLRLLTK